MFEVADLEAFVESAERGTFSAGRGRPVADPTVTVASHRSTRGRGWRSAVRSFESSGSTPRASRSGAAARTLAIC